VLEGHREVSALLPACVLDQIPERGKPSARQRCDLDLANRRRVVKIHRREVRESSGKFGARSRDALPSFAGALGWRVYPYCISSQDAPALGMAMRGEIDVLAERVDLHGSVALPD
jgi:hypothetical protein